MSYEKQIWQSGQIITATKMNNIEEGLKNIDEKSYDAIITLRTNGYSSSLNIDCTIDKCTFSDFINKTVANFIPNILLKVYYYAEDKIDQEIRTTTNNLIEYKQVTYSTQTGNDIAYKFYFRIPVKNKSNLLKDFIITWKRDDIEVEIKDIYTNFIVKETYTPATSIATLDKTFEQIYNKLNQGCPVFIQREHGGLQYRETETYLIPIIGAFKNIEDFDEEIYNIYALSIVTSSSLSSSLAVDCTGIPVVRTYTATNNNDYPTFAVKAGASIETTNVTNSNLYLFGNY